jgi:hypothetical protein
MGCLLLSHQCPPAHEIPDSLGKSGFPSPGTPDQTTGCGDLGLGAGERYASRDQEYEGFSRWRSWHSRSLWNTSLIGNQRFAAIFQAAL